MNRVRKTPRNPRRLLADPKAEAEKPAKKSRKKSAPKETNGHD